MAYNEARIWLTVAGTQAIKSPGPDGITLLSFEADGSTGISRSAFTQWLRDHSFASEGTQLGVFVHRHLSVDVPEESAVITVVRLTFTAFDPLTKWVVNRADVECWDSLLRQMCAKWELRVFEPVLGFVQRGEPLQRTLSRQLAFEGLPK